LCSALPPLRRLLENQLPITTGAERLDWPSYAATSTVGPLLLVLRLYSIVVQPRRDVRLEMHRRRLHVAEGAEQIQFHTLRPLLDSAPRLLLLLLRRALADAEVPSWAVLARRAPCRGGPRGRGAGPAPSSPPRRSGGAACSRLRRGRKPLTGAPPSAGSVGCPSA
jgi:hypothetical protein